MIKYNDNNIYIGYIKQLLKDFNLPNCRVYRDDLLLAEDKCYLKDNYICVCKEGNLEEGMEYREQMYIPNLTSNLKISNLIYDSYTHKYLGRYLRFLKDYYKVDLMSMYNCFSYDSLNYNISLGEFHNDDGYVIYSVPIRFFEEYTIGINCATDVEFIVTFVGKDGLLDVVNKDKIESKTYLKKASCSLNHPFVFDKLKEDINIYEESEFDANDILRKEECLRLLIKVPFNLKSSIVVVEGNYLENFKVNYEDGTLAGEGEYLSKLQLFSSENSRDNNLVSDRLLEYLLKNTITPLSEYYDIKKLQKLLIQAGKLNNAMYGTWDDEIRKAIYKYIKTLGLNSKYYDMISYVDKDVETNLANLVVGGLI